MKTNLKKLLAAVVIASGLVGNAVAMQNNNNQNNNGNDSQFNVDAGIYKKKKDKRYVTKAIITTFAVNIASLTTREKELLAHLQSKKQVSDAKNKKEGIFHSSDVKALIEKIINLKKDSNDNVAPVTNDLTEGVIATGAIGSNDSTDDSLAIMPFVDSNDTQAAHVNINLPTFSFDFLTQFNNANSNSNNQLVVRNQNNQLTSPTQYTLAQAGQQVFVQIIQQECVQDNSDLKKKVAAGERKLGDVDERLKALEKLAKALKENNVKKSNVAVSSNNGKKEVEEDAQMPDVSGGDDANADATSNAGEEKKAQSFKEQKKLWRKAVINSLNKDDQSKRSVAMSASLVASAKNNNQALTPSESTLKKILLSKPVTFLGCTALSFAKYVQGYFSYITPATTSVGGNDWAGVTAATLQPVRMIGKSLVEALAKNYSSPIIEYSAGVFVTFIPLIGWIGYQVVVKPAVSYACNKSQKRKRDDNGDRDDNNTKRQKFNNSNSNSSSNSNSR